MTAAQLTGLDLRTDPSVVDAACRGDRRAFGKLFAQYAPMVHGILLSRVPREQADDLVQDVFVVAMERISGLREHAAFGGWLAAIARNRAVDHLRTRRKTTELPDDLAQSERNRSEAEQVLEVIRTLPEAYRETLVLRLVEGMSGPEIAARVGLTPESVRVNLHRGMKLLREKLGADEP
jgi:RNA polymerase sigma-70 factor (ECF subfamily)